MAGKYVFNGSHQNGTTEMYSEAITITPKMAEELLKNNVSNRRLSQATVNMYAAEMAAGRWHFNGEAIMISVTGKLLNGQHRLHAIIKYGKPVTMYVTFNVSDDATLFDRGRPRTTLDTLVMGGIEKVTATYVAVAKLDFSMHGEQRPSDYQVEEYLERNINDMERVGEFITRTGSKDGGLNSANACVFLACLYAYKIGNVRGDVIKEFARVYRNGYPSETMPSESIITLRRDIMNGLISTRGGRDQRILATRVHERAIADFNDGIKRMKTYVGKGMRLNVYSDYADLTKE